MSAPSQLPYRNTGGRGRKAVDHKTVAGYELKYCNGCKTWRSLDGFNKSSKLWDGLKSRCIACDAVSNEARRKREAARGHEAP